MLQSVDREAENLWTDWRFERLVASLVQDAARAAQQVDVTTRPRVQYVRHLTPPSCSRCAVLAGRVYRWSQGFLRHPGCDCTMLPTTVGARYAADPVALAAQGLVTDLSKADRKALAAGADFNRLANTKGGLSLAGTKAGPRLSPAAIYRQAGDDRNEALRLLEANGYIL